jgi:hypothetical protein
MASASGNSVYDPDAGMRRPWNAGRKLGAKRHIKLSRNIRGGCSVSQGILIPLVTECSDCDRSRLSVTNSKPHSTQRYRSAPNRVNAGHYLSTCIGCMPCGCGCGRGFPLGEAISCLLLTHSVK